MSTIMQNANLTQPNWRLGEIGEVIKERMNTRIDDVNQLSLYMQRNEADLIYGTRILAQLEAILEEVRRQGVCRDSAVAVESVRPGTIPDGVRRMLTSNYSRTHQKETIVALESWANAGRFGLIALLIMAIVKILGWILSNGNAFGGAGNTSPEDYIESVNDRAADMAIDESTVLSSIKTTVLKDAYINAVKEINKDDLEDFNIQILLADDTLTALKAETYLNELASVIGGSPFEGLFKDYRDKRANSQMVIHDILDALLRRRVTSAVYNRTAAEAAFEMLPKNVREAGVLIPTETVFFSTKNTVIEMEKCFNELYNAFNSMRGVDLAAIHADKKNWNTYGGREHSTGVENYLYKFQSALRTLNDQAGIILAPHGGIGPFGKNNGVYPACVREVRDPDSLVGWEVHGEIGQCLLFRASDATYLCTETLQELSEKVGLSVDDERAILAAVVSLDASKITKNKHVTEMNGYSRLQKTMDKFVKELNAWQDKMDKNPEFMHWISESLKAMAIEEPTARGYSAGRDLQLSLTLTDESYFDALRSNLGFVKVICSGMAVLNNVIKRSEQNPFVKGKK